MDLAVLGKKAFFIPTPGQTEQKFLAKELKRRNVAFYQDQKDFDLELALQEVKNYSGFRSFDNSDHLFETAMDDILTSLPYA